VKLDVMRELERRFPPEFRNRIDDVVLFSPLSVDEVRAIAKQYLGRVEATLRERRKSLIVDDEALEAIVAEGHSLAYGARFLKRVIDDRIKLPISEQWSNATQFHVRVVDGAVQVDAVGPRLVVSGGELAYGT
jgi:ATP-dependent Clp protease ATP-binding subunit ClpA